MLEWLGLINTQSFFRKKWFSLVISYSCLHEGEGGCSSVALHHFLCFPLFAQERGLDCVRGIVLPGTELARTPEWQMLLFQKWQCFQPIKSLHNCICSNKGLSWKGFRSGRFLIQGKICLTFHLCGRPLCQHLCHPWGKHLHGQATMRRILRDGHFFRSAKHRNKWVGMVRTLY